MDQMVILQRILQILQGKIQMGAGGVCAGRKRVKAKAGYLGDSEQGGVTAGKRRKRAGVSAGKRKVKKAGVSAGKSKGKKTSKWIEHVKAYKKKHNCTYTEALKKAGPSYKK